MVGGCGFFFFFLSFFQSRTLEVNAHNISFVKGCLCKRVANFVRQDRNVFPRAIVGRLEKCVQETWARTEASLTAIIRMSWSARCKLAHKLIRVVICTPAKRTEYWNYRKQAKSPRWTSFIDWAAKSKQEAKHREHKGLCSSNPDTASWRGQAACCWVST